MYRKRLSVFQFYRSCLDNSYCKTEASLEMIFSLNGTEKMNVCTGLNIFIQGSLHAMVSILVFKRTVMRSCHAWESESDDRSFDSPPEAKLRGKSWAT